MSLIEKHHLSIIIYMIKCKIDKLTSGNFDDGTEEVLAKLQAEESSE